MTFRRTLLALAVCLLAVSAFAQFTPLKKYRFADIPWGSSPDEVSKRLSEAGFPTLHEMEDTGLKGYGFTGRLLGAKILGVTYFTPENKLVRVMITFKETPDTIGNRYEEVRKVLVDKYGEPLIDNDDVAVFRNAGVEKSEAAAVQLMDDSVALIYESPDWNAEVDRMEKERKKVF